MQIRNEIPHPHQFSDNTYISIDSEWFGLETNKLHRPGGKFGIMTFCAAPDFVYYITETDQIPIALKNIDNCVWVIQNAKFDITQLRQYADIPPRPKVVDTMLMERILWNGYFDLFAQEHLERRYLDEKREDKTEWQKWWQSHSELTEDAIHYSCLDANNLRRVWDEQKKHITKADMKIWREVDLPALWAVLDFQGFRIDTQAWRDLATANKEKVEEIDQDISVNPRSPKQVLELLQQTGFRNIPSTGAKVLGKYMKKFPDTEAYQIAEQILDSRKYSKRASTYGEGFLEKMVEHVDGLDLVFSDWNITGAETGRMSASGGMHNIPIRDTDAFRKCFIPRPGHKLVIADYNAQEARITAYLTQDERLIDIFKQGKSPYIEAAREIFGKTVKKGDKEYSQMKSTFLGMDYGMSEFGLAEREGISVNEAIELINKFFGVFPGIKRWVEKQKEERKVTYTVSGRKAWLNPYSNQCERNALNNPHQGTAADITKKALGKIYKDWGFDCPFGVVGVYHDEIVLDVPEKQAVWIQKYVETLMIEAAEEICHPIPFKVDAVIADNWAEKG